MPRYHILIVDDQEAVVFSYRKLLENESVAVDGCMTKEKAFALINERQYDAIITDYRLTHSESEEGLEIIMVAKEKMPDTPIFVLTAYGSDHVRKKVLKYEATVFLDKPVPPQIIINLLEGCGIPAGKK